MATSAAGPLVANPGADAAPAALPGVPSAPGWLALRHCPLGGNGPPVDLALLHPKIGVALVDFAPTPFDAADRLRRALDARRFPAVFGGFPPIVHVVVPADRLPDLGGVLSARFRAEPRFALGGGDAWLPTARSALEEGPPAAAVPPPSGAGKRDVPPRRAAALLLGAAAAGAAAAAVAVTAPPWGGNGDQRIPAMAAAVVAARPPEPAVEPLPPPPGPAREQADAADPEPDLRAGPDAATAAPQEAEVVEQQAPPPPPSSSADRGEPEPPPSPPPALAALAAAPFEPAPADADDRPWPVARPAAERPPRPRVAAAEAPAGAVDRKRCHDILVKATSGGELSDGDKRHMLRGCKRARN